MDFYFQGNSWNMTYFGGDSLNMYLHYNISQHLVMSKNKFDLKFFTNGDILWMFQEMHSRKGARLVHVNVKTHDMIYFLGGICFQPREGQIHCSYLL
jgi:hypothetical protein